jgi:apolipoprotein N-acyltransferase
MAALGESADWRRRSIVLASIGVSAALYTAAYPPIHVHTSAFVALIPLFLVLDRCTPAAALGISITWSLLAMSVGVTDWLVPSVARYYDQPALVGAGLLVGTTLVGASPEYGAVGLWYRCIRGKISEPLLVLATAATWAAAELCRTRIGFGNPWGLFGYAILDGGVPESPWRILSQVADLGGVYAVTFVLVAVNAGFARGVRAILDGRPATALGPVMTSMAVLAAAAGYGGVRAAAVELGDATSVAVAVVQPNLDLGSQWEQAMYGRNLGEHLDLTEGIARSHSPATVFWPENAMTFFVDQEPAYRAAIGRTLAGYDLELVAGAPRFEQPDQPAYFNSAFVLAPGGEISARYDKRRLLPFGEYFPLGAIGLLRRNFGRMREITPGDPAPAPPSRVGRLGMIICNEAMYPEDARDRVREGAEVLVNLSNDSWVGDEEFAETQLRIAAMRAIETRRFLVRASTSGPSAIVSPSGRVAARSALFEPAVVIGEVSPRSDLSVYARVGDSFAWTCLAVAIATIIFAIRLKDENGR